MNNQTTAAVCGCISLDLCPAFLPLQSGQHPPKNFASIIRPGAITRIRAGGIYPGGSVANTGLAMEYFGSLQVLCAQVGQDPSGHLLEQMLSAALRPEHRQTALSGIRRSCTIPPTV